MIITVKPSLFTQEHKSNLRSLTITITARFCKRLQEESSGETWLRVEKRNFEFINMDHQQDFITKVLAEYLSDFSILDEKTTAITPPRNISVQDCEL